MCLSQLGLNCTYLFIGRCLLPHQAGNIIGYRAVAIVGVVGLIVGILRILSVKSITSFRTGNLVIVVIITGGLAR